VFAPTVDVVAQIGRDHLSGSGDFGDASNTASNRAIGIQLSVPLYTGGLRSARATETQALADEARAALDLARQQVAQQTRAAWLDLAVGRSQTAALAAALAASRARLDATRTGVQAGDRTTLDLLNAENDTAAAELSLQQARVRLLINRLRLAASAGELDDSLLQQLNAQWLPHS
jgi:outer membrane protein